MTLPLAVLLASAALYAQVTRNGQPITQLQSCTAIHADAAVNLTVTLTTPSPPNGQSIYICGWDYTASQDSTGGAQSNVQWTTTNLSGLVVEYSAAAAASTMVSGTYNYAFPVKAAVSDRPVTLVSPAIAAHTAYSANLYYTVGP